MRALFALSGLVVLAGCGPSEPRPLVPVDDPRAYVREQLVATTDPSWFRGDIRYNIDDPVFLDSLIDVELERTPRLEGTLPGDEAALDRFVRDVGGRYSTAMAASGARRAQVEALIREHFEAPPVEMHGTTAFADLGMAPSRLEEGMRSGSRLTSPEAEDRGELAAPLIGATIARMHAAQPDAEAYQFEVVVTHGSGWSRLRYHYATTADRLHVKEAGRQYMSTSDLGGLDALMRGTVPTHTFDMEWICAGEEDGPCPAIWVE